jgi:hypothetical protein
MALACGFLPDTLDASGVLRLNAGTSNARITSSISSTSIMATSPCLRHIDLRCLCSMKTHMPYCSKKLGYERLTKKTNGYGRK